MTPDDRVGAALFREPLPDGFSRRVFRVAPGLELGPEPARLLDAIAVVEQGELELECRAGGRWRFGRGSMIAISQLGIAHLRSVGRDPLVLVAVSRAGRGRGATDEFPRDAGSYSDC